MFLTIASDISTRERCGKLFEQTTRIMPAASSDLIGYRIIPAPLGFVTLLFHIRQAVTPSTAGAIVDATGSYLSSFLLTACAEL